MFMLKQIGIVLVSVTVGINTAVADSWFTWSEFSKNKQSIQIFLSSESNNRVGTITQLSQTGMNITPTVLATSDSIWVAWVDRANPAHYLLQYVRLDINNQQIIESGQLKTADSKTYAPVIAQTAQGVPVLAWSGLDGHDEEIRLSFYRNGHWQPELSLSDNDLPDTLPIFTKRPDGSLQLNWEQIEPRGITTFEYTISSELTSLQHNTLNAETKAIKKAGRHTLHQNLAIDKLPLALADRQHRFFMGSKAEVQQ